MPHTEDHTEHRTEDHEPSPASAADLPSSSTPGRGPGETSAPARVVLFGRAGCHLCDVAREVVRDVCAGAGESWVEVDVDAPGADLAAYDELVPVVEVDGVRQGYWRIDAARVAAALAAGRAAPSTGGAGPTPGEP